MSAKSYKLLEPFKLGPLTLRNRIVLAPMGTSLASDDGSVNEGLIDYYTKFARGSVGLVITEGTNPDNKESRVMPTGALLAHQDRLIPGLRELAKSIKGEGAAIICQLGHAGASANPEVIGGLQPIAPSAVAPHAGGIIPKEMDQEKINEVEDSFAAAAARVHNAGFDGVELHGAHHCLFTQFLSPLKNKRKDKYGGSIENRLRIVLEICEKIRARTGPEFIVGYRICADEKIPGGITPEDVVTAVKMLEKAGVNYISVTSGTMDSMEYVFPPIYMPRGINLALSQMIKKAVNIPLMCAGSLDVETSEKALKDGQTDLIAMGRGLLADPDLTVKLMEGREEDIRPCILCGGCTRRPEPSTSPPTGPHCPRLGTMVVSKVTAPKKVLVVGGGAGGMEAARLAAERGHKVTLIERESNLGGHVLEASAPEFKKDLRPLLKWQKNQLDKEGVEVRLSIEATPELVKKENPNVLIIAVGSDYAVPPELAKDEDNFVFPIDVLLGQKDVDGKIVVAGGGFVGCETALHIAEALKKRVTIVEMLDDILMDLEAEYNGLALRARLEAADVEIRTGLTLKGYSQNKVTFTDKIGKDQQMDADSVVLALGLQPRQDVVAKFEGLVPQVFKVGDCLQAKDINHAFESAWQAVSSF